MTVNVVCGSIVATTAEGITQTRDLGGSDTWFLIDSVSNMVTPCCPSTIVYAVSSTDDTAHPSL